jgi:peptidoglycan/xylan/chitin deacetylase (PgdA/CDA1 family)
MKRADFLKLAAGVAGGLACGPAARAQEAGWDASGWWSCPSPEAGLAAELGRLPGDDYPSAFVHRGPRAGRRVALTFDDGPKPGNTERVLETLARFNAKGTFFLIGQNVKAFPKIAEMTRAAGHEVANHSYTHPKLSALGNDRVVSELTKTQDAIFDATGFRPVMFRPPYGAFVPRQKGMATDLGLTVVMWSVDPLDWRNRNTSLVTQRVLGGTRGAGDIILTHDIHATTVAAIPAILEGLTERGYELVTVSELLGSGTPVAGG